MKKNNMLFFMIGFSIVLHGLVLFGVARNGFRTLPLVQENWFISTVKIIKTNIAPQNSIQNEPQEEKIVEKSVEPLPAPNPVKEERPIEPLPVSNLMQETEYTENTLAGNSENSEETQYGTEMVYDSGTVTSNEYDELLVYIKEFINKNLAYPPMARRRNIQGVVGVSFEIGMNGELVSAAVVHSSGSSILDNAAVSLINKIHPFKNIAIKRKLVLNVNIAYELTE
ncbi:MAG: TonB family protein [Treponema sp.]|jgi:TonB family protein|nr:TonB family protein [Treponema sp.]